MDKEVELFADGATKTISSTAGKNNKTNDTKKEAGASLTDIEVKQMEVHTLAEAGAQTPSQDPIIRQTHSYITSKPATKGKQPGAAHKQEPSTKSNNQDTVVMMSRHGDYKNVIMMMHDTRIFYWEVMGGFDPSSAKEAEMRAELLNLFLDALTTKKYRTMRTLYLIFRIMDEITLITLVANLFIGGTKDMTEILFENRLIFFVLGSEVFYNIMQFVVRVWILNRVSIYIGFFLFGLYALVFWERDLWGKALVQLLYNMRLFAFLMEELVDYCLDLELSRDFTANKFTGFHIFGDCLSAKDCIRCLNRCAVCAADNCCGQDYAQRGEELVRVTTLATLSSAMNVPDQLVYRGSVCAWTFRNTFHKELYDHSYDPPRPLSGSDGIRHRGCSKICCNAPHRCVLSTMVWVMLIISSPFILCIFLVLGFLALLYGLAELMGCLCRPIFGDEICKPSDHGCTWKGLSRNLLCGELFNEDGF